MRMHYILRCASKKETLVACRKLLILRCLLICHNVTIHCAIIQTIIVSLLCGRGHKVIICFVCPVL